VAARDRALGAGLVLGAGAVAVLWPLSAYVAGPYVLPALLAAAVAATVILSRPEYGIALAIALAPLTNATFGDSPKPFQFLIPALAFGLVAYGVLSGRHGIDGRNLRLAGGGMLAFGTVALIASAQGIDPARSVTEVILVLTAIALFFAVRQVCRERRQLLVVVGGALAGLLIAAVHGLAQQQLGVFSTEGFVAGGEVVGRIYGSFGHPNFYGAFLAGLIPLAVVVVFEARLSRPLRWLALTALALALPALVLSYARGAIIGLVAGAVIWLAVLRPRLAIAVVVATAIAAVAFAPASLKERFDPGASGSDVTLRSDIWSSALAIYAERPLLGTGLDNFPVAYQELPSTTANAAQRRLLHNDMLLVPPHPQSIYLQALAEEGIVGLLVLLAFCGVVIVVLFRTSRVGDPVGRGIGAATGVAFAGLLIHGFLEVPLLSEASLPLFALIGVAAVFADLDRDESKLTRAASGAR
jgi:O-antigen ligase